MKVAFTTSHGTVVDGNFQKANDFTIWHIGIDEACYVTTICVPGGNGDEDDRIAARAEVLKECAIVCARTISGPAAAKLVARQIYPLRTGTDVTVEELIGRLQGVLKGTPAPWLRKAEHREQGLIAGYTVSAV